MSTHGRGGFADGTAILAILLTLGVVTAGPARAQGPSIASVQWSQGFYFDPVPWQYRHLATAAYDTSGRELFLFGGYNSTAGERVSVMMAFNEDARSWEIVPDWPSPAPRYASASVFDARRRRIVLFGGAGGIAGGITPLADLHAFYPSVRTWSPFVITGQSPPPRMGHSMVLDEARDRVVVFGGYNPSVGFLNDVWVFSLDGNLWTRLTPEGTAPSVRNYHVAVFDPVRDRMLVIGGNSSGAAMADVWALDFTSATPRWAQQSVPGATPAGRFCAVGMYDAMRDRVLIEGGTMADGTLLTDFWTLTLTPSLAWTQPATSGSAPRPLMGAAGAYDPVADRWLVAGGYSITGSVRDLYGFDMRTATWDTLETPGSQPGVPDARYSAAAVLDPVRHQVILHGGDQGGRAVGDTWRLELDGTQAWFPVPLAGAYPFGRFGHTLVYDPARDAFVRFGGYEYSSGQLRNDVWTLRLLDGAALWAQVALGGTRPSNRNFCTAVWDPGRDRMLLFGGNAAGTLKNDLWSLDYAGTPTWNEIQPLGVPPSPRMTHAAVMDSRGDRMLIYGGYDGARQGDLWQVAFTPEPRWSLLATTGNPPPARGQMSLALDESGDRLLLYAGTTGTVVLDDLWELDLASLEWRRSTPSEPWPRARFGHVGVFDPATRQMIVFGGIGTGLSDTALRDSWYARWDTPTSVSVSLVEASATPDSVVLRWISSSSEAVEARVLRRWDGVVPWDVLATRMFDGRGELRFTDHHPVPGASYSYALEIAGEVIGETAVRIPSGLVFSFAGFTPNPPVGRAVVSFVSPTPSTVSLEVYDVQGRRLVNRTFTQLGVGRHTVALPEADQLSSGVYLLKLTSDRVTSIRRGLIVR